MISSCADLWTRNFHNTIKIHEFNYYSTCLQLAASAPQYFWWAQYRALEVWWDASERWSWRQIWFETPNNELLLCGRRLPLNCPNVQLNPRQLKNVFYNIMDAVCKSCNTGMEKKSLFSAGVHVLFSFLLISMQEHGMLWVMFHNNGRTLEHLLNSSILSAWSTLHKVFFFGAWRIVQYEAAVEKSNHLPKLEAFYFATEVAFQLFNRSV